MRKKLKSGDAAVDKLIQQIDEIDSDSQKVGRYVLTMFIVVFAIALTILAIVILNPQRD